MLSAIGRSCDPRRISISTLPTVVCATGVFSSALEAKTSNADIASTSSSKMKLSVPTISPTTTSNVADEYPMNEAVNVNVPSAPTSIVYLPDSSVTPPLSVPSTATFAPFNGSLPLLTTPTIDCANNPVIINNDIARLRLFINVLLFLLRLRRIFLQVRQLPVRNYLHF